MSASSWKPAAPRPGTEPLPTGSLPPPMPDHCQCRDYLWKHWRPCQRAAVAARLPDRKLFCELHLTRRVVSLDGSKAKPGRAERKNAELFALWRASREAEAAVAGNSP